MKKNIVLTIIFTVIAITAIAGIFLRYRGFMAGPPERHMKPGMEARGSMMDGNLIGRHFCRPGFMRNELGMSEEQISKINRLNRFYEEEHHKKMKELEPERKRMKELLSKTEPDLEEIRKVLTKNFGTHVELRMLRIKQGIEINKILTPEQINILKKRRNDTFRKRGKHFWRDK